MYMLCGPGTLHEVMYRQILRVSECYIKQMSKCVHMNSLPANRLKVYKSQILTILHREKDRTKSNYALDFLSSKA